MSVNHPPVIRVLAAVVCSNDRFLVCQRPPNKRHGGLWEFPGGKLEPGETLLMAATRELDEELAVKVLEVSDPIFKIADPDSPFLIEFVPVAIEGNPVCLEHTALAWATLAELTEYQLAPSDRRFCGYLSVSDTTNVDRT
jgi:8-oxo-dGTP diphosphatase